MGAALRLLARGKYEEVTRRLAEMDPALEPLALGPLVRATVDSLTEKASLAKTRARVTTAARERRAAWAAVEADMAKAAVHEGGADTDAAGQLPAAERLRDAARKYVDASDRWDWLVGREKRAVAKAQNALRLLRDLSSRGAVLSSPLDLAVLCEKLGVDVEHDFAFPTVGLGNAAADRDWLLQPDNKDETDRWPDEPVPLPELQHVRARLVGTLCQRNLVRDCRALTLLAVLAIRSLEARGRCQLPRDLSELVVAFLVK